MDQINNPLDESIFILMNFFQRSLCFFSLIAAATVLTNCTEADIDHFYGLDVQPGYNGPSNYQQPSQYQAPATDSFYEQQNAAREANLKAVRDQQYKNEMQNYQNGYRSTLPNY